jgi:hypothetical protein
MVHLAEVIVLSWAWNLVWYAKTMSVSARAFYLPVAASGWQQEFPNTLMETVVFSEIVKGSS